MASDKEGSRWYQRLLSERGVRKRARNQLVETVLQVPRPHQYPMVAEDDVDVETLQAQIDMSMSFAHNLVTSWIKPTHFAQLRSSNVSATQILEEELRRPTRYATMLCVL